PPGTPISISNSNPGGTIYYTTDASDPRLIGGAGPSGTALVYSSAIPINATKTLKARILYNGFWSALTEAVFTADLSKLRISEMMYAPPAVTGATYPVEDYEYIELLNTGASAIDLSGVQFTNGV